MAKTLDAAGVKRLIQEIKGANKNLNTPIPISTENTPESMAQNVKNIADYVEKAKAAGIASVDGMGVTCIINDCSISGLGYIYVTGNSFYIIGMTMQDDMVDNAFFMVSEGEFSSRKIAFEGTVDTVTSDMLAEGARKPIILTPDTTEVDEETYQKLLSDDVDVMFKSGGNLCMLTFKLKPSLSLVFTGLSLEGDTTDDLWFYGYEVSITNDSPHNCIINQWYNDTLSSFLGLSSFIDKSTLSPVLQEIDLTGTDAERKAKLDQFETNWKALTGASHLAGARFVGLIDNGGGAQCLLSYNEHSGYYSGISAETADNETLIKIQVSPNTGSIITTPLFSHLEAITIRTGNTPDAKAANVAAIKAYVDNLTALGVDVTKGYMIPCKFPNSVAGVLSAVSNSLIVAITTNGRGELNCYEVYIGGDNPGAVYSIGGFQLKISSQLTTTSKQIVGAINEINANAVHSDKLVPTLEAITIKTDNTPEHKQANLDNIAAYEANLQALGVDTTKGWNAPASFSSGDFGTLFHIIEGEYYLGIMVNKNTVTSPYSYGVRKSDGYFYRTNIITQASTISSLHTTSKQIVGAINEVNALAKSKQDALTSGTNIKTVNGQSLLGSGDIAISGGGGSAPVLVDIDDISGSAGVSVPVDVFNKIANAASAKTPIFGYSKLVNGQKTTCEIIPLYVKNVSTSDTNGSLLIQFIAANDYNSVGIMKRSDTECSILTISSRPFALDTSVDKSSTRGIQSSAVWNEIHSEPMTVNTATSGVTTLSSTDKHKILCYADSGIQQYNLPSSPVDGETFLFMKVKSGHEITIQSGTGNENIYDCSSGNSVVSKTIATSTKGKITVIYSSTVGKWLLMANDFIS